MSLASIFKAAQTAAKASKALKGAATAGKVIWTLGEIADMGMDTYMLGDQIARAIMGDDYDPEIKDLSYQVAEKGVEYDQLMVKIAQAANVDIPNLSGAIALLYGITADFESTNGIIFEKCAKLEALVSNLLKKAPTSYTWFTNSPSSGIDLEANKDRIAEIRKQMSADYATIALHSVGIGLRSAYLGYSFYKKRTGGGSTPPSTRPRRNAMANVFEGMDQDQIKRIQSGRVSKLKRVRSGLKTYGKVAASGFTKLLSVGSFGMNIYMLIEQKKQKDEAKKSLRKMIADYEQEIRQYNYVLNGCKNADGTADLAAIETVAKLFNLDLTDQDAGAKDALAIGYRGVLADYDATIDDMVDGIDDTYQSMIETFESVLIDDQTDVGVVQTLRSAYSQSQPLHNQGKDEKEDSDRRKTVLDQISTLFSSSVAKQINEINQSLNREIANYQALSMLEPFANKILRDIKRYNITVTEEYLQEEAESAKELLDVSNKDRDRFTTIEEIVQGLKVLIAEAQQKKVPVAA